MSNILFIEGFDFTADSANLYNGGQWSHGRNLGSGISTTTLPYNRGKSYVANDTNFDYTTLYDWGSENQTVVLNCMIYIQPGGWNNDNIISLLGSNGWTNVSIVGTSDSPSHRLSVVRGNSDDREEYFGTWQTQQYRWMHIEMKVYFHATAGTIELRVNGSTILDLTNLNTIRESVGIANASGISIGKVNTVYVDNLVIHDGTVDTPRTDSDGFLGPVEVITLWPNADSTPNQWTRSTGTNGWEIVDNDTPSLGGQTDAYLTTNTATNAEKFGLTDLPSAEKSTGAWQIKGVQAIPRLGIQQPGKASVEVTVGTQVTTGINCGSGQIKWQPADIHEYSTGTTDWTESDINSLTVAVELE